MYQIEFYLPRNTSKSSLETLSEIFENYSVFEDNSNSDWLIHIVYENKPAETIESDIISLLNEINLTPKDLQLKELPKIDWLAENRKSFPAMTIGSFFIYGSHLQPSDIKGLINIQLDASLAFGTGKHATTKACLELIQEIDAPVPESKILDLGCGTAILAMAMAKLWNLPIIASDIDHDSVHLAEKNATLNNVSDQLQVIEANGFDHPLLSSSAPYDLIVANILAAPLIELAPEMTEKTRSNATLILSGLLITQKQDVIQAYTNLGFELIAAKEIEVWAALLLKKKI